MDRVHIDVVNASTLIPAAEARRCVVALRRQLRRDFAPAWGKTAELRYLGPRDEPDRGAWRLVLLDDRSADDGYHELTPEGFPQGKVFIRSARRCSSGWTSTASHELLELLVNPDMTVGVLVENESFGPRLYSYEVCDAVQDDRFTYEIDGVPLSDFVTPAWFEPWRGRGNRERFDHAAKLKAPFQVPRACYAMFLDVRKRAWVDNWGGKETPHLTVPGGLHDRGGSRGLRRGLPRASWRKSTR